MERVFYQTLLDWKKANKRKPLLLQGARQTGKTWILQNFGETHFKNCLFIDFAKDREFHRLFEGNLEPTRIINDLNLYFNKDYSLKDTLFIFDEVQLCPNALTSLKYFFEAFPSAYICASGSLLGLGLSTANFPVGKVQREWLYPMSFSEFLNALGETALNKALYSETSELPSEFIHEKTMGLFKEYLITGGLPESIAIYITHRKNLSTAYKRVRKFQLELIESYVDDMAKHSGNIKAMRIASVFNNIPDQLARENKNLKKFVFKGVLPKDSNHSTLEGPIEWLSKAGLIHRVPICNKAEQPLSAYTKSNFFTLYLFDIGILGAMLNISPSEIHLYKLGQFKGYLAENFVLQELIASGNRKVYSWQEKTSQIEFLLEGENGINPIEVKAGINTKAKSLKVFKNKYNPHLSILLSTLPPKINPGHSNLPIYLAFKLQHLINQ